MHSDFLEKTFHIGQKFNYDNQPTKHSQNQIQNNHLITTIQNIQSVQKPSEPNNQKTSILSKIDAKTKFEQFIKFLSKKAHSSNQANNCINKSGVIRKKNIKTLQANQNDKKFQLKQKTQADERKYQTRKVRTMFAQNDINQPTLQQNRKSQISNKAQIVEAFAIRKSKKKMIKYDELVALSRTGLQFNLQSMQKEKKKKKLIKIQNHKAKTDKSFQKTLFLNCDAILSEIETFKNTQFAKKLKQPCTAKKLYKTVGTEQDNHQSRYRSIKKEEHEFLKSHSIDKLKISEKIIGIKLECKAFNQSHKPLQKGLQIFEKYALNIQRKLKADNKKMNELLYLENEIGYKTVGTDFFSNFLE